MTDSEFGIGTHPDGSVVIVTSAGSGIGQATAALAAQNGYRVAGWDINPEGMARTIAAAGEHGARIAAIAGNVTDATALAGRLTWPPPSCSCCRRPPPTSMACCCQWMADFPPASEGCLPWPTTSAPNWTRSSTRSHACARSTISRT